MKSALQWLPAAASLFFWGLWGFFPKIANREIGHPFSAAVYQYCGTVICFATVGLAAFLLQRMAPSLLSSLHVPAISLVWNARGAAFAALAGICGAAGGMFSYRAASRADISVVVTFTALYPLVTVVLAWIFLGERIDWRQWIGIVLALVAMALLAPRNN